MNRRNFSLLVAAGLGATLAPAVAHAAFPDDAWAEGYARARDSAPWTLGFRNTPADLGPQAAVIRGRFPAAVHGVLYRNGPAIHELGGQRYRHWFDGDGMVQRIAIGAAGVVHSGSVVRTAKYRAEVEAGKRLQAAFGSQWPGMQPIASPDALNAANTSVLPIGDEVLALWEGGSATRLQADTLRTLGPKVWRDDLAGAPFSAHPRVDPDGTIWNFGLSPVNDMLVLYQIDGSGRLLRAEAMPLPQSPMVHDFAVTHRHLVFLMPPLIYSHERAAAHESFMDSHVWHADQAMRVLVVDKDDWSRRQWLELPAGFLFHLGNAWEDAHGVIRVDYIHAADPTALLQTDREVMRGRHVPRPEYHIACARIDPRARTASQELLRVDAEFPRIDPHLTGLRHRHLYHAAQLSPRHPGFCAVARSDVERGTTELYRYGDDHMVEEHVFVAEPGSPPGSAGWVLGTALDLKGQRTLLSCFRSDRLADGPVAQATLPVPLPLGFHGMFVRS